MNHVRQFTVLSFMVAGMFFLDQTMATPLTQKDSELINTLFAQTKLQCIGRYVIDVP